MPVTVSTNKYDKYRSFEPAFSEILVHNAVAQRYNAGLAIERARVRILFATVSKFGHFRSLHDAQVHPSCINEYLAIDDGGNMSG